MRPIKIRLPGGDYVAGGVTWKTFKAITRLAGVSSVSLGEDDWLNLAGLVVEIFGNQFNVNALRDIPVADMIEALNQVLARVRELSPKPNAQEAEAKPAGSDWMIDLEISLVKSLGWSLHEIDETALESLLQFIGRLNGAGNEIVFADQVDWL